MLLMVAHLKEFISDEMLGNLYQLVATGVRCLDIGRWS